MREEILALLKLKDERGASAKWLAQALELLLRIELLKLTDKTKTGG